MPQQRLPMTGVKTILGLTSLGLSQRQIAQSCQVGKATISDTLAQPNQVRLGWPDIATRTRNAFSKPSPGAQSSRHPPRVPGSKAGHPATALGGIPPTTPRRLSVQPLL